MYHRPLLLLLALASIVMLALSLRPQAPLELTQPEIFKDRFYIQSFEALGYNEQGRLDRIVKGSRMNQPVASEDHYIQHPDVTLFEGPHPRWHMTAKSAWMDEQQHEARLNEDLALKSLMDDGLALRTSNVDVDLTARQLNSEETVTILETSGTTKGKGLHADLNASRFEIKSNVESVYEP